MALREQLELGPREVVCLVGGGGKSTLLEALAAEYDRAGLRAVVTTTTKIMPPEPGGRPLVLGETWEEVAGSLERLWSTGVTEPRRVGASCRGEGAALSGGSVPAPVVGTRIIVSGKLDGVPVEWVSRLRALPDVEGVFVEADGAARLPLKAPAAHEPVIPACATLVVAMTGLDAQWVPLDDAHVHRAGLLAELLDYSLGERLAPEALLRSLLLGYQDRVPSQAHLVILLNKADAYSLDPVLEDLCRLAPVDVWVGSLRSEEGRIQPVLECLRRIPRRPAVVVLAAGLATRLGGRSKVTLELEGVSLVGRAVRAALAGGAQPPVVVVTGGDEDRIREALLRDVPPSEGWDGSGRQEPGVLDPWRLVCNPRPEEGIGRSLARGAAAAYGRDLLVLLADQPFVTGETVRRLLHAWERASGAAATALLRDDGSWGPPVVINRSLLPDLVSLTGDQGASRVLRPLVGRVVFVAARDREGLDIDTFDDLEKARSSSP